VIEKQVWFQVEFLSSLEEEHWVALMGRAPTIDGARDNRRKMTRRSRGEKSLFRTRIVRVERAIEVVEE
jgi:hypothetical protein